MNMETWDLLGRTDRELAVGRRLDTGAPLTGTAEHDEPDFAATDADGLTVIPDFSHVTRAHVTDDRLKILRRPYNYDGVPTAEGHADSGLIFASYQADIATAVPAHPAPAGRPGPAQRVDHPDRLGRVRHPARLPTGRLDRRAGARMTTPTERHDRTAVPPHRRPARRGGARRPRGGAHPGQPGLGAQLAQDGHARSGRDSAERTDRGHARIHAAARPRVHHHRAHRRRQAEASHRRTGGHRSEEHGPGDRHPAERDIHGRLPGRLRRRAPGSGVVPVHGGRSRRPAPRRSPTSARRRPPRPPPPRAVRRRSERRCPRRGCRAGPPRPGWRLGCCGGGRPGADPTRPRAVGSPHHLTKQGQHVSDTEPRQFATDDPSGARTVR